MAENAPKTHNILTEPIPNVKPKIWTYTDEQQAKITELRKYANTLALPESDPYYPNERKWLASPGCIERYLRASKWNMDEAKRRINGTLQWRRDYKPDLIPADEVQIEAETGKIVLNGFDLEGRPVLYLRPGRENTKESPRQIRHLVFHIERAIDLMPPGQEAMACLVDYKSTTLSTTPSISNARKFLTIVQQHYVERLGRAIVVNLPMILNFFMKAIQPFMDPVTRDKIRFNPNLLDLFPAEQLDAQLGGEYQYEFEHEAYWKLLCDRAGVRGDGSRFNPNEAVLEKTEPQATSQPTISTAGLTTDTADEEGSSMGEHNGTVHPVDPVQLQAIRQNVIAKYEHTQANLERNRAGTEAAVKDMDAYGEEHVSGDVEATDREREASMDSIERNKPPPKSPSFT